MAETGFDEDRIRAETFVGQLDFAPEMGSTNDQAAQRVRSGPLPQPLLVLTARQTAGRGRSTNSWWAAEGALTFSLVLPASPPQWPPDRWPQLSLLTGLAVCRTLQQLAPGLPVGLKWPNDVLVRGRKICGILVEVPAAAMRRVVVGVGLNVNNAAATAPPELRPRVTSLSDETDRCWDLTDVLVRLLRQFHQEWLRVADDGQHLTRNWAPYCVLTNRQIVLEVAGREVRGRCLGIDEQGAVRIDTGGGVEHHMGGHVKSFH